MSGYQWAVVMAAWLGWGFDIIDALLFNFVAENCVPTLVGVSVGTPEALAVTRYWTGMLTSVLLVGWAVGGIFFGWLADKVGRTRTLLLTIVLYSIGTALCAVAPNIQFLVFCRILSSLGIGGEWAAGAAMVAEVVPRTKRVEAGALLYTSAPVGLICAAAINSFVTGVLMPGDPARSWRVVFLFGLLPALVAALLRLVLKEPEAFTLEGQRQPSIRELFSSEMFPLTRSGLLMAVTALLGWWSLTAFMPLFVGALATQNAQAAGLSAAETGRLIGAWKQHATNLFSVGGFIGTMLTVPFANRLGRKGMFFCYFVGSAAAIVATFGTPMPPEWRVNMQFFIGLTVFGVFGSFTYYLPELFPTRLRATGAGFCYNIGRIVTAFGPVLVGEVARGGLESIQRTLLWVVLVPLFGICALPWVIETRVVDDSEPT